MYTYTFYARYALKILEKITISNVPFLNPGVIKVANNFCIYANFVENACMHAMWTSQLAHVAKLGNLQDMLGAGQETRFAQLLKVHGEH